ncbi:nif-specific transcriptional activator NifA [Pseudooceanicola nanhaiensis]|uniref:nif-specific transcriptional activator NifA n=1 Tax=Pseudooceanicola nanhaiensis TaxID=375761 RepID=UPI001CD7FDFA|nr:nif-specific transcriptional activator NifA [Pseudooceanicola nanhaiensis]MCA0920161.1 nif-specific transcriptional activator NifA [Pseudooceanicola nanhaiensis]
MQDDSTQTVARAQKGRGASASRDRLALDAVFEIAKSFAVAPDPIDIVPDILNVLSSFLDLRHGVLALLSDQGAAAGKGAVNPYSIAATAFARSDGAPAEEVIPDEVVRIVFRSGVPLVSFDLAEEFGVEAVPKRLRGVGQSVFAVPIRDPERSHFVLGVLCAFRSHDDGVIHNTDSDIRVLTMVASLLEQALRFRRRIARDRERALTDTKRLLQSVSDREGKRPVPVHIDGIVGDSPAITDVIAQVRRVAAKKTPVLLRGESGTGKELFARAVHSASPRARKPFVGVNCAALSETLLESELFGHEKGAFTGATALKKGRFEMADGGTLFLDEIGEISPTFQTKLLRVLQEGEFERVGGTRTIKVDVRIVAATNRDLERCVADGEFRADLYFRICVVPIVLPPLRHRKSDIRPLAQLFLDRFNNSNGTDVRFASDAFETICRCNFPGNVRELENCVSRAAALSDGEVVLGRELACQQGSCLSSVLSRLQDDSSPIGGLAAGEVISPTVRMTPPPEAPPVADVAPGDYPRRRTANTAREELIAAMEEAGWVQAKAARLLGMTPRQVAYALQKHGIEVRRI